ncbi:hypothetical protein RSOLAG1IB_01483 [Rhizoctonia solani AG-1 IB]|uniref:Uncharacterized protein n=1 Tax=Thanatephorus cucumeris (strain AG1-IB / isolate 7/3/14) TaxID=1108050 RepID=A0A0B7FBP2_THACB|nr:hypothetical protein RSOLAG1IB_01483 [Rhizoctonia solani AG-1 IB]
MNRKYQNPHHYLNEESLRIVSRQELGDDWNKRNEPDPAYSKIETDPEMTRALGVLNKLLSPLATDFTNTTSGCKRKRGDIPKPPIDDSQVTEIRLVSHRSSLLTTSEPVNGWPSQPKTYPGEDTDEQAQQRRERATQVAVDFRAILKQSVVPYPEFKAACPPAYKTNGTSRPGTLAVVDSPRPKRSRPLHLRMNESELRTHQTQTKESLVVIASSGHAPPNRSSETPTHTFYYSEMATGGKSAGYAWGYPGSFPRPAGVVGYVRDSMKKGLNVAVTDLEVGATQVVGKKSKIRRDPY